MAKRGNPNWVKGQSGNPDTQFKNGNKASAVPRIQPIDVEQIARALILKTHFLNPQTGKKVKLAAGCNQWDVVMTAIVGFAIKGNVFCIQFLTRLIGTDAAAVAGLPALDPSTPPATDKAIAAALRAFTREMDGLEPDGSD